MQRDTRVSDTMVAVNFMTWPRISHETSACSLFGAEHANVQPHSGSQANMAVYFATLKPGDTILSMNLSQGGHLSHGSPVNFSGLIYNVHQYGVDLKTETMDYGAIGEMARKVRPKIIVCGASAYPREIDFNAFSDIANDVGAYCLADIAHIAGLCATGIHPSTGWQGYFHHIDHSQDTSWSTGWIRSLQQRMGTTPR